MIREAILYDAPAITTLINSWVLESTGDFPPCLEYPTTKWVLDLIQFSKVWVTPDVAAVMAIGWQPLPWNSEQLILKDQFLFVAESMRGLGVGHELLEKALDYAKEINTNFYAGMTSGIDVEKTEQFYTDHGGHPLGGGAYLFKPGE